MQNVLIYLGLFFSAIVMQGQTETSTFAEDNSQTQYQKGMQKAMSLYMEDKSWEAANIFERIASAEPDNWLPYYYVAQINVLNSFNEKDKTKLTAQLNKAQDFINDAMSISKENPEILVLQAQLYTAWIVFDGQQYGMIYSPKASELYNKALKIAPENPRIILAAAEWNIGSSRYFGQRIDSYCKDIEKAIELFATFKPAGEFYPTYGKERAEQILKENCR